MASLFGGALIVNQYQGLAWDEPTRTLTILPQGNSVTIADASGVDGWSLYPATSGVDLAGFDLSNSGTFTGTSISLTGTITSQSITSSGTVSGSSLSTAGAISGGSVSSTGTVSGANLTTSGTVTAPRITPGGSGVLQFGTSNMNYLSDNGLVQPTLHLGYCDLDMGGNVISNLDAAVNVDEPAQWGQVVPMTQFMKVYCASNFSIPDSTNTVVQFSNSDPTTTNNSQGYYTLVTGANAGIQVNTSGIYEITGSLCWDAVATGNRLLLIYVNNQYFDSINTAAFPTYNVTQGKTCVCSVSAGQVIQIVAWQNSGSPMNVLGGITVPTLGTSTFLFVRRIG